MNGPNSSTRRQVNGSTWTSMVTKSPSLLRKFIKKKKDRNNRYIGTSTRSKQKKNGRFPTLVCLSAKFKCIYWLNWERACCTIESLEILAIE
mmetsp:Transcript_60622/g.148725  ORF Transcript_60622/g.148725 Transcript_60622/m.148725 type:complete len:92 (-) Transcript_60622:146-421(-)